MTGAAGPATTDPAGRTQTAAALQSALAAENAAIYGYGVAGAQLGTAARVQALRDWTQHEVARDQLQAMLTSLGVKPVAAQPAYRLPFPVHGTRAAISLAGYLENQVAARLPGYRRPGRLPAADLGRRAGPRLRAARDDLAGPDRRLSRAGLRHGSGHGPAVSLAVISPGRPRYVIPRRRPAWPARRNPHPRMRPRFPPGRIPRAVGPSRRHVSRRTQLPSGADSTCATRSAARSSSVAAAIRSAHDHQNHQLPSSQQPA